MTNQQLYFAIGIPVFAVIFGVMMNVLVIVWQSNQLRQYVDVRFRSVEDRLDKIERTLEIIQTDLKEFYRDITRLKQKTGLD
jgi:type IV secretory pathway VirB3-like protein